MANVKKGQTVPAPQWWNRDWKRVFWKRQRRSNHSLIAADLGGGRTQK